MNGADVKAILEFIFVLCVVLALSFALSRHAPAHSTSGSQAAIPRLAFKYRADLIRNARFSFGLEAPTSTFASQIHAESGWNAGVCNRIKACGLGQIMPRTATGLARTYKELGPAAPLNPQWALRALLFYNRDNFRLAGNGAITCSQAKRMLASYNAGPGVLKRKSWPRETQYYVKRILFELEPLYESAGWGLGSCP
jgi:soluble lytic murein transglycosylase-like protein